MVGAPANLKTNVPVPWGQDPKALFNSVSKLIHIDAMVVGVVHEQKPQLDEILAAKGCSENALARWCDGDVTNDALFRAAKRRGVAISEPNQSPPTSVFASQYNHLMVHVVPESLSQRRWWWLATGRKANAFTATEQELGSLLVNQWRTRFNQIDEPGMGRLLIGHDDRLIHADPWTQSLLIQKQTFIPTLVESMHRISSQRWNTLNDGVTYDFAIELADRLFWICFRCGRAVKSTCGHHWYIETRQLEEGELPAVGWVEDDRIAKSIAFIHDQYNQSPSLDEIAQAVHLSPFHFHRLFTKNVGISPKQYLQKKQLQIAKWLLRSSRQSIGRIASHCGFSSHGHFTSTFTRLVDMSPSQYRERH